MLTPQEEPPNRLSKAALFRYQVLSQVLACLQAGGSRGGCVRCAADTVHVTLDGTLRRTTVRTVQRWLKAYETLGLPGLEPRSREHIDGSTVLPTKFLDFLVDQKGAQGKDRDASLPELIKRACELGILDPDAPVCRSSVWRAAKRLGLSVTRRKQPPHDGDTRRFEYPHRMQMIICDGKHFRAGAQRLRRVALFFLDDATRYVLHVVVGTSETAILFLRGLYELIRKYGLLDACFLDNGPGFIAQDTIDVMARLEIPLIHGTAGYPQGRGKGEKFNRTAKAGVLRGLDRRPDVDPALGALALRLLHYIEHRYNHEPHEALGGLTPSQRFQQDPKQLRFPESDEHLRSCFTVTFDRRVTPDHIVSVDAVDYEVPRGHAGEKLPVYHRLLEDTFHVVHEGRFVRIYPVDLAHNARSARGGSKENPREDPAHPLPRSAADIAFERDFPPLVDPDGGFSDTENPDTENPDTENPDTENPE